MRMLRIPGLVAIVLALTTAAVLAHQVTYKGTVIALDKESVSVTVVDDKTKKPVAMKFDFDKETKILRGRRPSAARTNVYGFGFVFDPLSVHSGGNPSLAPTKPATPGERP